MKVLIFSQSEISSIIKSIFKDNKNFQVLCTTYAFSELTHHLNSNDKLVIIIDLTINENIFDQVSPLINSKNMKMLTVCTDVRHGFDYLGRGAHEMIVAPQQGNRDNIKLFGNNLFSKITKLYRDYDENNRTLKNSFSKKINKIGAIGSSTGGTEIILRILKTLPKDTPPILIVQHMPAVFTKMYAKRLNGECLMSVWEAQDGDRLENGLVLIAPGDKQMRLKLEDNKYIVTCSKEPPVGGHIPSVDVLFNSVAESIGKNAIGVILTGMGSDGAYGLLNMRKKGAYTLGQDEKSSIVYGMPKIAYDIGAVSTQTTPDEIAKFLQDNFI